MTVANRRSSNLLAARNQILPTMTRWAGNASAPSNSDADFALGFVQLIRRLGLDECMQSLVFLRGSKKFEGDAASVHRRASGGFASTQMMLRP